MATIFGEADALLSMIASRPPTAASRRLVIDQSDPLANARRQEMNGSL